MKPTPAEVAIELAGGLVDRRTLVVWSRYNKKDLLGVIRARKLLREHHPNRTKRFWIFCDEAQHQVCALTKGCIKQKQDGGDSYSCCRRYELGQSYTVMELGDDRS